jgi:hypothetical protein
VIAPVYFRFQFEFLFTSRSAKILISSKVAEIASVTGSDNLCTAKKQYAVKTSDARNTKFVKPDTGRCFTALFTCLGTLSPQT